MTDRVTSLKPASVPGGEPGARPKVMRRPAHFSNASPSTVVIEPALKLAEIAVRETPVVTSTRRTWQDDSRFAIMLLAIVVVINLAVVAGLAQIGKPKASGPSIAPPIPAASTPTTTNATLPSVTVFAKPEADIDAPLAHLELTTAPAASAPSVTSDIHRLPAAATDE